MCFGVLVNEYWMFVFFGDGMFDNGFDWCKVGVVG